MDHVWRNRKRYMNLWGTNYSQTIVGPTDFKQLYCAVKTLQARWWFSCCKWENWVGFGLMSCPRFRQWGKDWPKGSHPVDELDKHNLWKETDYKYLNDRWNLLILTSKVFKWLKAVLMKKSVKIKSGLQFLIKILLEANFVPKIVGHNCERNCLELTSL